MQAVRDYLESKAETPREWLRREPRETHPDILAAVRAAEASGLFYDDDVERFTNERLGGLPAHEPHGDRHPLIAQLGHEVYIARRILDDEAASAIEAALLAEGFAPLDVDALQDGKRYVVRFGTSYVGHEVPSYGEERTVTARKTHANGWLLMPPRSRTRGYLPQIPALVKEAS